MDQFRDKASYERWIVTGRKRARRERFFIGLAFAVIPVLIVALIVGLQLMGLR